MKALANASSDLKQYLLITGNYWAFTLTDGALRMLVVLHFHQLGYSPLSIALLFLFYELFGVITNLFGGWLGARWGLNKTMNIGLGLQILALAMLLVPTSFLTVVWVMAAQALSGIAKDLNKMSAKSAIKLLVPTHTSSDQSSSSYNQAEQTLYKWVAILTGSKNTLKGAGFFLGGVLLMGLGFSGAVLAMALMLTLVWCTSLRLLKNDLGKTKHKPKFSEIFSKSRAINLLSAARLFLFGARDVWFVVALPVFLATQFGWDHWSVGGFLALWIMAYGGVQTLAPKITQRQSRLPDGNTACLWASLLMIITLIITITCQSSPEISILGGLMVFGALFAVNSSLHSYLIVSYADKDGVSLDVGFYYMANAMGRLIGTLLSGWLFQAYGLEACLWVSTVFIGLAAALSLALPKHSTSSV